MCFTGIGRSAAGALEDALEQIASSGEFDVETNADLLNQCRQAPDDDDVLQLYADCNEAEPEESELYYTVSIRLK
jgi:hypothetical protein